MRQDRDAPRHAADGAGHARVVEGPREIQAGTSGRWRIAFEAGPLGIAEGGSLFLQTSPFWGWSSPQVLEPQAPGYTTVSTSAADVELGARTVDQQLLAVTVRGASLAAGERIVLDYGAGPAGARADRFAERGERLWIAVDGDGDGVRALLADSPRVDVLPGPASRLILTLPSTARPGQRVTLRLAFVDSLGNHLPGAGPLWEGELTLQGQGIEVPERVRFGREHGGVRSLELIARQPGVVRIQASGARGLEAESNPLQVSERGHRVLWGDLQCHSGDSDGTGRPEDLLHYAREVAGLDVVAITDHDHWGFLFLDQYPQRWQQGLDAAVAAHRPHHFVTLPGYEWTSWIWGHRHVLFFGAQGRAGATMCSSLDESCDQPEELWQYLRQSGAKALTVPHHPAGGAIAIDWSVASDPELEPVVEVVSVHGSSEAPDGPRSIYAPVPGRFVREVLATPGPKGRQYLGFIGSSDGHDGHPGLAHLASPSGGLAAILSEDLTREGIYQALRERRVYATNGPRILLRASFGGHAMGAQISVDSSGLSEPGPVAGVPMHTLVARALAPGQLSSLQVVGASGVVTSLDCEGERECALAWEPGPVQVGDFYYLRALQQDGGAAWSSPFYFVAGAASPSR